MTVRSTARRRPAYTIVELFLTIAVLMIVLGLMVNVANSVRDKATDRLTRRQLRQLTERMDRYVRLHAGQLPDVTPLVDPARPARETDLRSARNAADLRLALDLPTGAEPDPLIDPWGTPIAFLARQNPAVGMAPGDQFFFVSAGRDRAFLTRDDNLYSYEETADGPDGKW